VLAQLRAEPQHHRFQNEGGTSARSPKTAERRSIIINGASAGTGPDSILAHVARRGRLAIAPRRYPTAGISSGRADEVGLRAR